MTDNVQELRPRRKFGGSGPKSKPSPPLKRQPRQAMERPHHDYMIRFYKKTGKDLTKKAQTELSPIFLLNTSPAEVARALWRAENLRTNKEANLACEVERFEGPKGWKPYPREFLTEEG